MLSAPYIFTRAYWTKSCKMSRVRGISKVNQQLRHEGFQILWEVNDFKLSVNFFRDLKMQYSYYTEKHLKISWSETWKSLAWELAWKTEGIRQQLALDEPEVTLRALSYRDLPNATWRGNIGRLVVDFESGDDLLIGVEILPYLDFAKVDSVTVMLQKWPRDDFRKSWQNVIEGLRGLTRSVKHVEITELKFEDREALENAIRKEELEVMEG